MSTDTSPFVQDVADGCSLSVKVHPGARKSGVTGFHARAVKIALTAPPEDGRANEALIALMAELLGMPKGRIRLVSGAASRSKVLRVQGRSAAEVQSSLSAAVLR